MDRKAVDYAKQIIDAYVDGNYSEELDERFQAWLSDDNFSVEKDAALEGYWNSFDTLESEFTYASLARVKESIGFPADKSGRRKDAHNSAYAPAEGRTATRRSGRGWMVAAIVIPFLMLVAGGVFFWRTMGRQQEPEVIVAEAPPARIEVAAPDADKKIMLVDGTQIWIKKGGRMSYPETYTTEREIELDGEAYFDVAKNGALPLTINTDHLAVTVTGTELNVNTLYKDKTEVRLVTGSVEVSALEGSGRYRMAPGEDLVIEHATKTITVDKTPVGRITDWRKESLVFSRMTLDEVFTALSKLYNIPFEYDAARLNGDDRLSFTLNGTEDLTEVMTMIHRISGKFTYIIEEGKVNVIN